MAALFLSLRAATHTVAAKVAAVQTYTNGKIGEWVTRPKNKFDDDRRFCPNTRLLREIPAAQ
jgi:hypothetical protein